MNHRERIKKGLATIQKRLDENRKPYTPGLGKLMEGLEDIKKPRKPRDAKK